MRPHRRVAAYRLFFGFPRGHIPGELEESLDNPAETKTCSALACTACPDQVSVATSPGHPVVLDAYGLEVLPELADSFARSLTGRLVLIPNDVEAARLLHCDPDELGDPADTAARVAERWGAVVSSNGHVADEQGRRWKVGTGHPGLGTCGSRDVLAGALAGLLARGASLTHAACWATHLHGAAGDRLAVRVGPLGFLARELLDELPLVLTELQA